MKNETRFICPKCNGDYSNGNIQEEAAENNKHYVVWECPHCKATIEEEFVLNKISIKES